MLIYSTPKFIKAGRNSYYDCYEREALCSNCGKSIGIQNKYEEHSDFSFEIREKKDYHFCPYCGAEFDERKDTNL